MTDLLKRCPLRSSSIIKKAMQSWGQWSGSGARKPVVVAVAHNVNKSGTFTVDERLEMLEAVLGDLDGVRITAFEGLLVDYAREIGAASIIRGLRANADFEYEFEMALMNRHMDPRIETLFLMTSQEFFYVSSSRLKELVAFGADISEWVPPIVAKYLREKLGAS